MLKQIIAMVIFSVIIVFSMPYVHLGLQHLIDTHEWISQQLSDFFSPGQYGLEIRHLVALLAIPTLIGLVTAFFYWLIRRHWLPFFMEIMWVVWLLQAGALVMLYK